MHIRSFATSALALAFCFGAASAFAHDDDDDHNRGLPPLVIKSQGSFAAGGTFIKQDGVFDPTSDAPVGMTLHGDHSYVQYQIPVTPRKYPLVMWHGGGQMGKTWEQTIDGREGYQSIFLRRDFSVYIVDQPRRGRAGNTTVGLNLVPAPSNETLFMAWRLGVWPNLYPNSQFPPGPEALNQFWRMMTPNTGPGNNDVVVPGVVAAIDKIGESVLLTHSASGLPGWLAAIQTPKIKGIYAYEPTGYVFPEGEVPPTMGGIAGTPVPLSDFLKLTKIPIVLEYSDGIPSTPSPYPRVENWRNRMALGKLMRDAINRYGGDAQIHHLPEMGLHGNTHFSFADLNNLKVADILSAWLKKKKLDGYPRGHGH
jgi:hypothetical protein